MRSRNFLLILLLVLAAHSRAQQQQQRFAVLPLSAAKTVRNNGTWKPSQSDIDGAEASISQISSLKAERWSSAIYIDHPEKYFRQYVPVIRAGKRSIYVNAFCEEPPPADWRSQLVIVMDGATCFWQALYDPATKTYSNLTINARA
jgi:hypothetical protein